MNISNLLSTFHSFTEITIDPTLLYDPANNPFVSFSVIYFKNGNWKEDGFSSFLTVGNRKRSSNFDHIECIALSKEIQASHLECRDEDNEYVKTDYGFCSSIVLNQHCHVIIAVIASPQDSQHIYTTIRNKVKIACGIR